MSYRRPKPIVIAKVKMKHANCRRVATRIVDSRVREGYIFRVRMCEKCKLRFKTAEIAHEDYSAFTTSREMLDKTITSLEITISKLRDHSERLEKHEV